MIDYEFLKRRRPENTTPYLKHVRFKAPILIRVDGKTSRSVFLPPR